MDVLLKSEHFQPPHTNSAHSETFPRKTMHRLLCFCHKNDANIEKSSIICYNISRSQIAQEYQWMICRILSKKEICNEKR